MAPTTPFIRHNHFISYTKTSVPPFTHLITLPLYLRRRHYCRRHRHHLLLSSCPTNASREIVNRVTTVPVEYAPPAPEFDLHKEIARLRNLRLRLSNANTLEEKQKVIDADGKVRRLFDSRGGGIGRILEEAVELVGYDLYLIKCLAAAGQEHVIRSGFDDLVETEWELESVRSSVRTALYALVELIEGYSSSVRLGKKSSGGGGGGGRGGFKHERVGALRKLLKTLREVEEFYDCMGGIIGYQVNVLQLLVNASGQNVNRSRHSNESLDCQFLEIHSPNSLDLCQNTEYASQAALWGIEGLPDLGEIYPLGGAADRLGLVDSDTGECLPAAMLPFCGRTLLEGLLRDLQAREFLYFKLYGKQSITPVAIMTSAANNNHERMSSLCEKLQWFGRGQSNFQLFQQPLVPVISADDGEWLVSEPLTPVCKPGGHGVIWKLAHDKGIFQWFHKLRRKGATIRQVSNVVAATDLTLLALAGIGLRHKKKLGFASCARNSRATEGINVLIEKKEWNGKWAYGLSCIEYTEFGKYGISNGSYTSSSVQEDFPANTNILYVDLQSAEEVGSSNGQKCLPGMVLNLKKPVVYTDHLGMTHSVPGGRLECTMQNIADHFCNTYSSRRYKGIEDTLDTFIVYNERKRVTSSAKKKRRKGNKSLHQTPDGALLDITRNAYDLLFCCNIEIPKIGSNDEYIESGPPFMILLHPALGPLWEVTRQKFSGGSISKGSELQIEVAEFLWRDVQLDGSMLILARNAMGSMVINERGESILQYGLRCARCRLQNVRVMNKGIDWKSGENIYWKHDLQRQEVLKVVLHGNAEFEAINVTLKGSHVFEVPDGHKLLITSGKAGLSLHLHAIEDSRMDSGSWSWNYKIDGAHVKLELVE
ncbi:UTP--glucose-1-phosphate uridylyltransferase 3, chloroplastic [Dionaea muscipula]